MSLTPHQAKYFAYNLTRRAPAGTADRLSMSLFDAAQALARNGPGLLARNGPPAVLAGAAERDGQC